ncbi:MAG: tetratricopeptide repeat protein [Planctomycetota bacterium]
MRSTANRADRLLLVGVLFLLLTPGAAPAAGEPADESPIELLQKGILAVRKQQFAEGREVFRRLLKIDPENATGHYYLALCEGKTGHPDAALAHLIRAAECGFEEVERLGEDPGFEEARRDKAFRDGVATLVRRRELRERGILEGLELDFRLRGRKGKEITAADFRGRTLALLFIKGEDVDGLAALLLLDELAATVDPPAAALALVEVRGKGEEERRRALDDLRASLPISIPLYLGDRRIRAGLKPFRQTPTLLVFDGEGVPRRIVEGKRADPRKDYRAALEGARRKEPGGGKTEGGAGERQAAGGAEGGASGARH